MRSNDITGIFKVRLFLLRTHPAVSFTAEVMRDEEAVLDEEAARDEKTARDEQDSELRESSGTASLRPGSDAIWTRSEDSNIIVGTETEARTAFSELIETVLEEGNVFEEGAVSSMNSTGNASLLSLPAHTLRLTTEGTDSFALRLTAESTFFITITASDDVPFDSFLEAEDDDLL